jgi:5-formyltetrahydrofolate cyclo-ligase
VPADAEDTALRKAELRRPLLEDLVDRGIEVIVPILRPDRDLDWTYWPKGNPLGIEAIEAAAMVLVPALAVDPQGMRLGRGGGSYDRALARLSDATPVVALVYDDELLDEVPTDPWDRPVTAAVTPTRWRWSDAWDGVPGFPPE